MNPKKLFVVLTSAGVQVDGSTYTLSLLNSLTPKVITGSAGSVFENY